MSDHLTGSLAALQAELQRVRAAIAQVDAELAQPQRSLAAHARALGAVRPGALDAAACPSMAFGKRVWRLSVPCSPEPRSDAEEQP